MSNTLAIAAVTATLHDILLHVRQPLPGDPPTDTELADTAVTAKPPDKARDAEGKDQLNLFLYQTAVDAAVSNTPPWPSRNGESSRPPVALKLYYLLTAYGRQDDDLLAHRLLGRAMSLLADRAVLIPTEVQAALLGNDLYRQVERVRVTPHYISSEEMSKLWTIFQTNYRISTAYEVSVVLLDSTSPARTPLPVLKRGPLDQGPVVLPDATPPYPTLTDLQLGVPNPVAGQPAIMTAQSAARLATAAKPGDVVTLIGHHLTGASVQAQLSSRWVTTPIPLAPLAGATSTQVQLQLPNDQVNLPAGYYTVALAVTDGSGVTRTSNVLSFAIAPRILTIAPANPIKVDGSGNATITLTASPQAWADQKVTLLVDDAEFRVTPFAGKSATLVFPLTKPALGLHWLRLRVDGVDSQIVADFTAAPLKFDLTQQVNITP